MKNYRIKISKIADECLLDIAEYIAQDNPTRAISFIDELTTSLQKTLSVFPFSGSLYDGLEGNNTIRTFTHGNYTSYYQVNESIGTVEILFILNSKRKVSKFIESIAQ